MPKNLFDTNKLGSIASILGLIIAILLIILPFFGYKAEVELSIIVLLVIFSILFGVVVWALYSSKIRYSDLEQKNNDLEQKNTELQKERDSLNEQLKVKPCLFIPDCQHYFILNKYIGRVNGIFDDAEEVKSQLDYCKKCASNIFSTEHLGKVGNIESLQTELEDCLKGINKQGFRVLIDSLEEHRDIRTNIQRYLAENGIHSIQLNQKEKIDNVSNIIPNDIKTIIIYLYCNLPHVLGSNIDSTIELRIRKSLESYSNNIIRINNKKQKGKLEVWLCSSHEFENIPKGVIVKNMNQCTPVSCVNPSDFPKQKRVC